jgi:TolB-like protein/cytochrome c-type biogenesis protein CcmH/NrfG
MSLFAELKRRNVFRVGLAYVVATWLLLQVVDVLSPIFDLPDWAPKLIFLILLVGFIPVIIFSWAFEMTPEGIKRESEISRDESITHHTAKKLDMITIGLLVAAIATVALDRFLPQSEPDPAGVAQDSLAATEAETPDKAEQVIADQKSIAVLPFVNMSDDAANEYFSDGISEEILNALAKVTDLKVAGRTSSFAFKGRNQDLREIGSALNVSHILEGSVRKAGNRVRITAQLIKVDDGYHLWSENYDRELDDVFAIQDEISIAILQQLKAHLVGEESTTVARTDSQAYELYLLASQRIYERNQASLEMASDLLNEAIAIDPGYAPAVAQLGIATLLLSEISYGDIPAQEADKKATEYFNKALELDPNQAEAMSGLGLYHYFSRLDYDAGIMWLEKALAINPNLVNASVWLSTALGDLGEIRKSQEILEATFARDPLHPATFNNLAQSYAVTGNTGKAREMLDDLRRYVPADAGLIASIGKVEVMAGNWAEADKFLTQAVGREPLNWVDRLWLSATILGTQQYERLAEMGADNFKSLALNRLGRTEEALLLADEWSRKGNDPVFFFEILIDHGRFEEVVSFLESRWETLDDFERAFPNRNGFGSLTMAIIAHAYSRQNEETKFNAAMDRLKASLDWQVAQGANNFVLAVSRAYHAVLSGDHEQAITFLELFAAQGGTPRISLTNEWSAFAPLRGDPRFEAVLVQIRDRVNRERAALGLEPVST